MIFMNIFCKDIKFLLLALKSLALYFTAICFTVRPLGWAQRELNCKYTLMHDKRGLPNGCINTNESKKKYALVYMFKTFV